MATSSKSRAALYSVHDACNRCKTYPIKVYRAAEALGIKPVSTNRDGRRSWLFTREELDRVCKSIADERRAKKGVR